MRKLYFIRTNGYDLIASVDEEKVVRYLTENEEFPVRADEDAAVEFLKAVEDDSSWEDDVNNIEDLIADNEVLAVIDKEL